MSFGMVNASESKVDRGGDIILGDVVIKKKLIVGNTLTINNISQTNGTANLGNIQILANRPTIDFHYNNSNDATSCLIEENEGYLSLNQNPPENDSSKKIATTEWTKLYPVSFAYTLVDENKEGLDVGSSTKPIYFKDGIPIATGNMLDKDISGNAATATYATNAGYASNTDLATHSTKSTNSTRATTADNYNQLGSLSLTGVVSSSGNFNSEGKVSLNVTSSQSLVQLPRWSKIYSMNVNSSGVTMTDDCFVIIHHSCHGYGTSTITVTHGQSGTSYNFGLGWHDRGWSATIIPLAKGDKLATAWSTSVNIVPIA